MTDILREGVDVSEENVESYSAMFPQRSFLDHLRDINPAASFIGATAAVWTGSLLAAPHVPEQGVAPLLVLCVASTVAAVGVRLRNRSDN